MFFIFLKKNYQVSKFSAPAARTEIKFSLKNIHHDKKHVLKQKNMFQNMCFKRMF